MQKNYLTQQDVAEANNQLSELLSDIDEDNKAIMLPILQMNQKEITKHMGVILAAAKAEGLSIGEFNTICRTSFLGGPVHETIRAYFPTERFNKDGTVSKEYAMIFSPMSDLCMYQTIIDIFNTEAGVEDVNEDLTNADISELALKKMVKDYCITEKLDWIDKKGEATLSNEIIKRIETKENSYAPINISWNQLEELQAKLYKNYQKGIVIIRQTSKGKRYILNASMYKEKPGANDGDSYSIDVKSDFVIRSDNTRDREESQRTFDVVKGTKFIIGDKLYTII